MKKIKNFSKAYYLIIFCFVLGIMFYYIESMNYEKIAAKDKTTKSITNSNNNNSYDWKNYVEATTGNNPYYLYKQVIESFFDSSKVYRAVNFGSGAGNEDIDLVKRGWEVTSIDQLPYSGEVIKSKIQGLSGTSYFQQHEYLSADLQGDYDLVMSFLALPFGNKDDLPEILVKISKHMRKGSIFVANFFGEDHDFVKRKKAYGITFDEIISLLKANNFKLTFFYNRIYKAGSYEDGVIHWDVLDIVATKL
jgi:SAM-dependent methyltransferase